MKVTLSLSTFLLFLNSYSQGWVGTGTSMYSVNASSSVTPLNVGIGTNSPSAQLHTTGTVRFGGLALNNTLNSVIVTDANGNLALRDATTLSGWKLSGNSITGSEFIGTTNAQPFRIRTNNAQRMIVGVNGTVGINLNLIPMNTSRSLQVEGSIEMDVNATGDGTSRFNIVRRTTNDEALIQLKTTSILSESYDWVFGLDNESTREFILQTPGSSTPVRMMSADVGGKMFIKPHWNGSIFESPSTTLEVNCEPVTGAPSGLKFNNIPEGSGDILVVNQGYVYKTSVLAKVDQAVDEKLAVLMERITQLETELAEMKGSHITDKPSLSQNRPNPSTGSTSIPFNLAGSQDACSITVTDFSGKLIANFDNLQDQEENIVHLETSNLPRGIYTYNLIVSGRTVDQKKLVIE